MATQGMTRPYAAHEALEILQRVGAVITDSHIVYTSGRHGADYINKNALYTHTRETSLLCLSMAEMCDVERIETVVGPATGGIILAQWVAHHLAVMNSKEVYAVFAAKDRKSTRLNSSHIQKSRMPSSA